MISLENSWQIFIEKARDFYITQEIFFSPKEFNEYKIIDVSGDKVTIKRLSVESKSEEPLTFAIFATAYRRAEESNGIIPKGKLYGKVMFEAPMVLFLPFLDWDENIKNILVNKDFSSEPKDLRNEGNIRDANSDDLNEKILRAIRIRRGQNKLRENLFAYYDGKCCITGCNIVELLHACHVIPHSQSGDNSLSNALLLRSDIHDLFDSHLLGINPNNLTVQLNVILLDSEYRNLEGKKIAIGLDIENMRLNISALEHRWQLFKMKST